MPIIVYLSVTGKTERLVSKINNKYKKIELAENNIPEEINDNFIMIIPSYATYEYPDIYNLLLLIDEFLEIGDNLKYFKGIVATGNYNFGNLFGATGISVSNKYNVPIIKKVEFSGNHLDIEYIEKELESLE